MKKILTSSIGALLLSLTLVTALHAAGETADRIQWGSLLIVLFGGLVHRKILPLMTKKKALDLDFPKKERRNC